MKKMQKTLAVDPFASGFYISSSLPWNVERCSVEYGRIELRHSIWKLQPFLLSSRFLTYESGNQGYQENNEPFWHYPKLRFSFWKGRAKIGTFTDWHVRLDFVKTRSFQVPEGHALLDLSLGPSEEVGPVRKALYGAVARTNGDIHSTLTSCNTCFHLGCHLFRFYLSSR